MRLQLTYKIITGSLILFLFMFFILPAVAFAANMSSNNFSIEGGTINNGGTINASSVNFALKGAFGEVFSGEGESSNFQSVIGAQNFISSIPPTSTPTPSEPGGGGGGIISQPAAVPSTGCNGADFNNDGVIDLFDFGVFIFSWQSTSPDNPCVDINSDGIVDIVDFGTLVFEWTG